MATPKLKPELLDELLKGQDPKTLLSSKGLFGQLKKALEERMLKAELEYHVGQPEEETSGNSILSSPPSDRDIQDT